MKDNEVLICPATGRECVTLRVCKDNTLSTTPICFNVAVDETFQKVTNNPDAGVDGFIDWFNKR